jgi:pyruvate kinase
MWWLVWAPQGRVTATSVTCLVTEGGVVSDNKGISLPEVDIRAATFSDKDAADLRFALTLGVDLVALSFVRDAEDATLARQVVASMGRSAGILAKIETPQAVKKLTDITASPRRLLGNWRHRSQSRTPPPGHPYRGLHTQ